MARSMVLGDIADLVDGTGDAAFAVDATHTIVAWNRAAEDLLGMKATDVLGRDCSLVIGGRNHEDHLVCTALCPFRLAMHHGDRIGTMELRVRRGHAEPLWVRMTSIVLAGAEPCVIHILHDITEDRNREAFVRQVMQAATALAPGQTAKPAANPPVLLSPRETEILRLLATGASTRAIAQTLCISPATVRNHIQQIMTSLRAHSRLEAVVKALQRQLF